MITARGFVASRQPERQGCSATRINGQRHAKMVDACSSALRAPGAACKVRPFSPFALRVIVREYASGAQPQPNCLHTACDTIRSGKAGVTKMPPPRLASRMRRQMNRISFFCLHQAATRAPFGGARKMRAAHAGVDARSAKPRRYGMREFRAAHRKVVRTAESGHSYNAIGRK